MKICYKCKEAKFFNMFSKDIKSKDKLQAKCKACDAIYKYKNKEKIKIKSKNYRINNKVKRNEEKKKLSDSRYYYKNKEIYRKLAASRRAKQRKATPKWLTNEQKRQIAEIYKRAYQLEIETGTKYHVDHIIPLKGLNISGLHVPWNLQILEATENRKKGNRLKVC